MHQSVLKNWVSSSIGELTCGYAPENTMLIRILDKASVVLAQAHFSSCRFKTYICAALFRNDIYESRYVMTIFTPFVT